MIENKENTTSYIVEDNQFSSSSSILNNTDKFESKKYNISIRDHNNKYDVGSIEIKLQNNIDSQIKDFKDGVFKWILFLLSFALFQTIVLLGIVYCVERLGIFAIHVTAFNSTLIFPYETGGFFFALVLISDLTVEFFRTRINDLLD